MTGTTIADGGALARVRAVIGAVGAFVAGVAPHVLHHVGPLAGAAILAGAAGRVLFGGLGLLLALPMLLRLRRRSGGWALPASVLGLMAAVFTLSSFVIGPAIAGQDDDDDAPVPTRTSSDHDQHH